MIVVTGAAGFIGSNIVAQLTRRGREDVLAVDILSTKPGEPALPNDVGYLDELGIAARLDRDELPPWLESDEAGCVEAIIHMGACSDTTGDDPQFMLANNTEYTRTLWDWAARKQRPFVYASSAATYGDGSAGYDDRRAPTRYRPLNLYGESKQAFDLWAVRQEEAPPRWAGLKYFNVYGPREGHKGRMASVALHAWEQIRRDGVVRLFRSHREGIADGQQKRDFVFVQDVAAETLFFADPDASPEASSGLYNAGTGVARSFEDLARAVFAAMGRDPRIEYVPMPEDLRERYQYFTEATMDKARAAGFERPFHSLEEGVSKYVAWLGGSDG